MMNSLAFLTMALAEFPGTRLVSMIAQKSQFSAIFKQFKNFTLRELIMAIGIGLQMWFFELLRNK